MPDTFRESEEKLKEALDLALRECVAESGRHRYPGSFEMNERLKCLRMASELRKMIKEFDDAATDDDEL